jgi:hypothetical protein
MGSRFTNKTAVALGLTGVLLVVGLQGVTAQADTTDVDAFAFTGDLTPLTCTNTTSGTLTPVFGGPSLPNPVPPALAPGVISCPNGGGNGVPIVGGSGFFAFNSTVCAGLSGVGLADPDGILGVVDAEVGSCSITANGVYSNIVCGTGTATGNATVAEGVGLLANAPSDVYNAGFDILFVAGVGVVTGSATESADEGGEPPAPVVGVVVLGPSTKGAVPPPGGECVTAFSVTGVIATTA